MVALEFLLVAVVLVVAALVFKQMFWNLKRNIYYTKRLLYRRRAKK